MDSDAITLSGSISTVLACCAANEIKSSLILAAPISIDAWELRGDETDEQLLNYFEAPAPALVTHC